MAAITNPQLIYMDDLNCWVSMDEGCSLGPLRDNTLEGSQVIIVMDNQSFYRQERRTSSEGTTDRGSR